MENCEKIKIVKSLIGADEEATDAIISVYLNLSEDKILKRLYPYNKAGKKLPEEYSYTQCELAHRLYLKRGAEGQLSHSENGTSRAYGSVDEEDILKSIIPFAEVL